MIFCTGAMTRTALISGDHKVSSITSGKQNKKTDAATLSNQWKIGLKLAKRMVEKTAAQQGVGSNMNSRFD